MTNTLIVPAGDVSSSTPAIAIIFSNGGFEPNTNLARSRSLKLSNEDYHDTNKESTDPSAETTEEVASISATNNTTDTVIIASEPNKSLLYAHIWLSVIGWGILVPIGCLIGHSFRDKQHWFALHLTFQLLGLATGFAGLIVIVIYCDQKYGSGWDIYYTLHRNLGVAVLSISLLQALSLVWRPPKGTKLRSPWKVCHLLVALAVMCVSVFMIYNSMFNIHETSLWSKVVYSIVMAAILAVVVIKDTSRCRATRNGRAMQQLPSKIEMETKGSNQSFDSANEKSSGEEVFDGEVAENHKKVSVADAV